MCKDGECERGCLYSVNRGPVFIHWRVAFGWGGWCSCGREMHLERSAGVGGKGACQRGVVGMVSFGV